MIRGKRSRKSYATGLLPKTSSSKTEWVWITYHILNMILPSVLAKMSGACSAENVISGSRRRGHAMLSKLRHCSYCQATWISTILVSIPTIAYNPFFVLAYPLAHIAVLHALLAQPRAPERRSSAQSPVERYAAQQGGVS